MMERAYFVTGTDTGVGKTFITASLVTYCVRRGNKVGVMKPIETGHGNQGWPEDARTLHHASGNADARDIIVPYVFDPPVSPWAATQMTGGVIDFPGLMEKARAIIARYQVTFIEGAGGLSVPIDENRTMADIPKALNIPVVIVSRSGLGTINHTVLTVEYAKRRGLRLAGIVMNQDSEELAQNDPSRRLNAFIIEKMTGVPIIGIIPSLHNIEEGPDLWSDIGQKIALCQFEGSE